MKKYIHIVFGDSAAGTLKYFFKNNENEFKGEIINFMEDHSMGPIYEIDTETGLRKRIEWVKKILKEVSVYDYYEDIEKEIISTYESIRNINPDSKIVIWYGENIGDQVGVRCLISLLRNKEIYEVNVSESYVCGYNDNRYKPRAFGECAPEKIDDLILTMEKLEKEKRDSLINDWEILRTSKENLRILKGNIIIGVDESYYDNDILSNCTFNFKRAARIIGATMGKAEQLVGDTYIDYRVRKLIESGKVEYRGKLETMRDFEVRVPGSLKEFFSKLFKKTCEIDADGVYHYLLEMKNDNLIVDTTHITKWDLNYMSNKLILDCDENNGFSLSWFNEGKYSFSINHIVISNIEFRTDEYEEKNGKVIREEFIILFSDDLVDRFIEIKIKPHICVTLAIDHSKI